MVSLVNMRVSSILDGLVFAEMSIGLKHKKSVSNLWIGRDPPPPLIFKSYGHGETLFFKLAILAL